MNSPIHQISWDNLIVIISITIIILYLAQLLKPWFRTVLFVWTLKGPRPVPIIGNALIILDSNCINTLARTAINDFGTVIGGWISIIPCIFITEPEHIQMILGSPKHTGKPFLYRLLHNFLGEGLITNTGVKWKQHRKLIQPLFTKNILETYIDTFADSSQCLLTKLEPHAGQNINITTFINNCVLDILNEAILGVPVYNNNNISSSIGESPFRKGEIVAPYRLVRPWLLFNWLYRLTEVAKKELQQKQDLIDFTKKMLDYNKNKIDYNGRKSLLAMFQEIAETEPKFTENDIIEEICTFMLAGQDSVGSAVSFCLYSLAKHQKDQEIVLKELDEIFKESDRIPTAQDLEAMAYLEQCVKETLRLYPSVPLVARFTSQDVKLNEKYTVPKNCVVFISPFMTQRMPELYPDPDSFNPNRFSKEECLKRHPYSFLPFSAGPRNCIGYKFALMEMKTVISTILRKYKISTVPGKENVTLSWRITVRARGGIWLKFIPRN